MISLWTGFGGLKYLAVRVSLFSGFHLVYELGFTYLWLVGNGGMGYNYNYYCYHSSIPY